MVTRKKALPKKPERYLHYASPQVALCYSARVCLGNVRVNLYGAQEARNNSKRQKFIAGALRDTERAMKETEKLFESLFTAKVKRKVLKHLKKEQLENRRRALLTPTR